MLIFTFRCDWWFLFILLISFFLFLSQVIKISWKPNINANVDIKLKRKSPRRSVFGWLKCFYSDGRVTFGLKTSTFSSGSQKAVRIKVSIIQKGRGLDFSFEFYVYIDLKQQIQMSLKFSLTDDTIKELNESSVH